MKIIRQLALLFYLSLNKIILAVQILVSKEGNIIVKGKIFITLVIVFSLVVCSGNLLAQERKSREFSLGAAVSSGIREGSDAHFVFSIGYHATIGFELGGLIVTGEGVGVILSANLAVSPFYLQRVIPYAIGGLWTVLLGEISGWNIGGGLKIKLKENMAIRIELRRWVPFGQSEGGAASISFGLSWFF